MVQPKAMTKMSLVVADVAEMKSGLSATGREWTKWLIKTADGELITTFSAGWQDRMGDEVTIYVEEKTYNGRVYLLTGSPPKPATPPSGASTVASTQVGDRAVLPLSPTAPRDVSECLSRIEGAVAEMKQQLDVVLDVLQTGEMTLRPASGRTGEPANRSRRPGSEETMILEDEVSQNAALR